MKVLFIVIASDGRVYNEFIRQFWAPVARQLTDSDWARVLLVYGHPGPHNILPVKEIRELIPPESLLIADSYENIRPGILKKTLQAIKMNLNYDFIVRTNLSSIINFTNLNQKLKQLPTTNLYAGVIGQYKDIKYASGALFIMSNDVCNYFIESSDRLDFTIIDDIAIGILLQDKYTITPLDRQTVKSFENFMNIFNDEYYHIRVKLNRQIDIDTDIKIFKSYSEICKEKYGYFP